MKKLFTCVLIALFVCATTAAQETSEQPCQMEDSVGYVSEVGSAINVMELNARRSALMNARRNLFAKLDRSAKDIAKECCSNLTDSTEKEVMYTVVEEVLHSAIEERFSALERICMKTYITTDNNYEVWMRIQVSTKNLVEETAAVLEQREELKGIFNREAFSKYAEPRFNDGIK